MPYCFSDYLDFIRQTYWVVAQEALHRKLCCRRMNVAAALHEGVPTACLDMHLEKHQHDIVTKLGPAQKLVQRETCWSGVVFGN
jgi:hypothetical protein